MKNLFCTVQLAGGLGNQLFGLAFGRYLQLAHDVDVEFMPALNLGGNNNHGQKLTGIEAFGHVPTIRRHAPIRGLRSALSRFDTIGALRVIDESTIKVNELRVQHQAIYRGYFQTLETVEYLRSRDLLTLNSNLNMSDNFSAWQKELANYPLKASLHVRFGDYLQRPEFDLDRDNYYLRACQFLASQTPVLKKIFVFSDNMELASSLVHKLQLKATEFEFVMVRGKLSALETLLLLTSFTHAIVANSTFSWWGSTLQHNSELVLRPDPWFASGVISAPEIPSNWIPIRSLS